METLTAPVVCMHAESTCYKRCDTVTGCSLSSVWQALNPSQLWGRRSYGDAARI